MSYAEDFKNKRALVTGGSRGIGRAVAEALLKYGAEVTVLGRNPDNLAALVKEHPTLKTICVDVTDWDKTAAILAPLAPFDILVNSAGTSVPASFMDSTASNFDTTFATNVKSIIVVSQAVAKKMSTAGGGTILNMSSLSSQRVFPYSAVYSVSKAAVDMTTKVMAVELGPLGIRVNSVNPAGVYTDLLKEKIKFFEDAGVDNTAIFGDLLKRTPWVGAMGGGPIVSMEQVVEASLFLLSPRTSGGTTGQHFFVDNGYMAA